MRLLTKKFSGVKVVPCKKESTTIYGRKRGLLMQHIEEKPYDYCKLRGRITEKYGSQKKFAKTVGTSAQTVSSKLNCRAEFSKKDILKWCEALDISIDEIPVYFFA